MLTGKEILKRIDDGITISPFNPDQIGPNSYDIRLHNELLAYRNHCIDIKSDNPVDRIIIPENGYKLVPGKIYLGRTSECIGTKTSGDGKGFTWILDGRSSIGRLGITTHVTAGFGDFGFQGFVTLEISVVQPVIIYPNIKIGQVYFFPLEGELNEYSGKYQDSMDIVPSRMFEDFK